MTPPRPPREPAVRLVDPIPRNDTPPARVAFDTGLTKQVAELRGIMLEVVERLTKRQDTADLAARTMSNDVADTKAEVLRLGAQLGRAPQKIDVVRASQHGNLTAAELTALEQGTGVLGLLGRLVARDARIEQASVERDKRIAEGAAKAAALRSSVLSGLLTVLVVLAIIVFAR